MSLSSKVARSSPPMGTDDETIIFLPKCYGENHGVQAVPTARFQGAPCGSPEFIGTDGFHAVEGIMRSHESAIARVGIKNSDPRQKLRLGMANRPRRIPHAKLIEQVTKEETKNNYQEESSDGHQIMVASASAWPHEPNCQVFQSGECVELGMTIVFIGARSQMLPILRFVYKNIVMKNCKEMPVANGSTINECVAQASPATIALTNTPVAESQLPGELTEKDTSTAKPQNQVPEELSKKDINSQLIDLLHTVIRECADLATQSNCEITGALIRQVKLVYEDESLTPDEPVKIRAIIRAEAWNPSKMKPIRITRRIIITRRKGAEIPFFMKQEEARTIETGDSFRSLTTAVPPEMKIA